MHKIKISLKDSGRRLDKFISEKNPKTSRSYVKFLIEKELVKVNKLARKPSYLTADGDVIEWEIPVKNRFVQTELKVPILYEDKECIVYDKPAGLVVHPSESPKPREEVALTDIIARDYPDVVSIDENRPGIVHRLDRDTSGIILVAKTKKAFGYFKNQFRKRKIKKEYRALLLGRISEKEGIIEASLARCSNGSGKMCVVGENEGKPAKTRYLVEKYYRKGKNNYTLCRVFPESGRTHQIRVHFSSIGNGVVGDALYSKTKKSLGIERQFLHASSLEFVLLDGKYKKIGSRLPQDLRKVLKNLEF